MQNYFYDTQLKIGLSVERNDLANFQIFHVYAYYETVAMSLHERLIYQSYVNCVNSANHGFILREEK